MTDEHDVQFPARCKPLPPGYRVVQLDSGHYQWLGGCTEGDWTRESDIDVDRWRVWRGAFEDAARMERKP